MALFGNVKARTRGTEGLPRTTVPVFCKVARSDSAATGAPTPHLRGGS